MKGTNKDDPPGDKYNAAGPRSGGTAGRSSAPASSAGRRSFCHSGNRPLAAMPQAISRLSKTLAEPKIWGTWKERKMPAAMISRGGRSVMSRPRKRMVPLVGLR